MPLVQIHTNVAVERPEADELAIKAGGIVAREIGKPESVMMALLQPDASLTFGGTTAPTALFEIEGIELSADHADALTASLSDLAEEQLGVPGSRVFVKLTNVPRGNWAGNRKVY